MTINEEDMIKQILADHNTAIAATAALPSSLGASINQQGCCGS
jgi:hypothetical protein